MKPLSEAEPSFEAAAGAGVGVGDRTDADADVEARSSSAAPLDCGAIVSLRARLAVAEGSPRRDSDELVVVAVEPQERGRQSSGPPRALAKIAVYRTGHDAE